MSMSSTDSEILDRHEAATPGSREAFARATAVMPGGAKGAYFYPPYPVYMERGDGCWLVDLEGRRLLDCANHHTAQVLGHNHPVVTEAIVEQLARGVALGGPTGIETELAEELCGRVESLERVRFCNSGTEATLHAVRLARGITGRPKIAKFEGAYHGSHDAVEISVSPPLAAAGEPGQPAAVAGVRGIAAAATDDAVILPYGDIAAVEEIVDRHAEELACILLDPKAGIFEQIDGFAQAVEQIARDQDILLIADEVVAFRLARGGWQQMVGLTPDLTTYGKLVGGGFPVGAFGGRAELMDRLDARNGPTGFSQSGTFSAHPIAMAAGLATLRQLTSEAFLHLDQLGQRLQDGLDQLLTGSDAGFSCVRAGSLFSLHPTDRPPTDYRQVATANRSSVLPVFHSLLQQGYYLSHGLMMNALSLPMQMEHVDGLVEAVGVALEQVGADGNG